MIFITLLGWLGWRHLDGVMPWPLVAVITVAVVFVACIGLTAVLARTPWSKALTGRSRTTWRSLSPSRGTVALAASGSQTAGAAHGSQGPEEAGDSPLDLPQDEGDHPLESDLASR
jgi:hypothetical protein